MSLARSRSSALFRHRVEGRTDPEREGEGDCGPSMVQTKSANNGTQLRSARSSRASTGFTDDERAAIKERAQEVKAARGGNTDGDSDVLAKIAEMPDHDRAMAQRLHAFVKSTAPTLSPFCARPDYVAEGSRRRRSKVGIHHGGLRPGT
jgi:hypothetical protein